MGSLIKLTALMGSSVAVLMAGAYLAHHDSEVYREESQQLTGVVKPAVTQQHEVLQTPSAAIPEVAATAVQADRVAKWLTEAFDVDPATRAAAIAALADAPRAVAVPTLQRVLIAGEPMVDRSLALNSLRTLALQHGDNDGGVRDAVRQAIYDGSDDTIAQSAQSVLDEVNAALDSNTRS
jgi:hypothetical protein